MTLDGQKRIAERHQADRLWIMEHIRELEVSSFHRTTQQHGVTLLDREVEEILDEIYFERQDNLQIDLYVEGAEQALRALKDLDCELAIGTNGDFEIQNAKLIEAHLRSDRIFTGIGVYYSSSPDIDAAKPNPKMLEQMLVKSPSTEVFIFVDNRLDTGVAAMLNLDLSARSISRPERIIPVWFDHKGQLSRTMTPDKHSALENQGIYVVTDMHQLPKLVTELSQDKIPEPASTYPSPSPELAWAGPW